MTLSLEATKLERQTLAKESVDPLEVLGTKEKKHEKNEEDKPTMSERTP